MANEFGVSENHEEQIVNFLRFSRLKRGEAMKAIGDAFQGVIDSRLVEETYTLEEVKDLLSSLEGVIRADIESELIYSLHTSVLVLRQACEQAEKWHLKLSTNISELENRELIQQVARFEALKFSDDIKSSSSLFGGKRLEPLNENSGSALLQMEIDRLKEENKRMSSRLAQAESTVKDVLTKKDMLEEELKGIKTSAPLQREITSVESQELVQLRKEITALKLELAQTKVTGVEEDRGKLQTELAETSHELLRVKAELEDVKTEMDKKFSETSQFTNMKKMLTTKNEQIKQLRERLKRYEPDAK